MRIDASIKAVICLCFAFFSFTIARGEAALGCAAFALILAVALRVPARRVLRAFRPFLAIVLLSVLVNGLVMRGGAVVWSAGPLVLWSNGLHIGSLMAMRTLLSLAFGVALVATTSAEELSAGLARLMRPLGALGLPVWDLALVLSIALRFIPLLSSEMQQVLRAQRSRGLGVEEGLSLRLVRSYAALVVPLLESSLLHAERLACALSARGFESDRKTSLRTYAVNAKDWAILFISMLWFAVCCMLSVGVVPGAN